MYKNILNEMFALTGILNEDENIKTILIEDIDDISFGVFGLYNCNIVARYDFVNNNVVSILSLKVYGKKQEYASLITNVFDATEYFKDAISDGNYTVVDSYSRAYTIPAKLKPDGSYVIDGGILGNELDLNYEYNYYKGERASMDGPGENEEFDIREYSINNVSMNELASKELDQRTISEIKS